MNINLPLQTYLSQHSCDIFKKWERFMMQSVDFWLTDSIWHTQQHSARVMFYNLILADRLQLDSDQCEQLATCSVFHDTRRLDEGLDKGHGLRAAKYYKTSCLKHGLLYNDTVAYIMAYHDQDDNEAQASFKSELQDPEKALYLYKIFKDADALDRYRLGSGALNVNFLRNEQSLDLIELAQYLNDV